MNTPLTGIRVIEFCHGTAGAYCGMLLADMGADVVTVDAPPGALTGHAHDDTLTTLHRNKRSVTLDLTLPDDRHRAHALVRDAHVLIESFRPGLLAGQGLGFEALNAVHPALVYASISAFGQDGPRAQDGAHDLTVHALRAVLAPSMPGLPPHDSGHAHRHDLPCDVPLADFSAGLYAAFAVVSALREAERTARGAHVDVPMLGATLAIASLRQPAAVANVAEAPAASAPGARSGARTTPYPTFRARDGFFSMATDNTAGWRAACAVVHRVDLLGDPRFSNASDRARHQGILREELEGVFAHDDAAVWLARLRAAGVPCAPISMYSQALTDPQVAYMGWVRSLELPSGGTTQTFGSPLRFNGTAPEIRLRPPARGEHNDDVFAEIATRSADTGSSS
ncbi:Acetyl-CoA:oxalate CoA-transferase [Pandoraea terrae]|uniref:Acetyl-CoA:oxalate CoA-transferase n=1 Tax=Pandoraea terrae TaxID=1537710 RepID=A0A5E4ZDV1_9BURK|nr:CoA transferase [Pandoraea terrae]VVE59561.1 Acetyl-CoA:oxalate CoA-transferase [Pandoraea terrae]